MTTTVILSQKELNELSIAQIAEHYNAYADYAGLPLVKKFRDKPTAVTRTLNIQKSNPIPLHKVAQPEPVETMPASEPAEPAVTVLPAQPEPRTHWGKITSKATALKPVCPKVPKAKATGERKSRSPGAPRKSNKDWGAVKYALTGKTCNRHAVEFIRALGLREPELTGALIAEAFVNSYQQLRGKSEINYAFARSCITLALRIKVIKEVE